MSKNHASQHWLMQRIVAFTFFILVGWFLSAVPFLIGPTPKEWFQDPMHAWGAIIFIVIAVLHHYFHLEEVIEDYVHAKNTKAFSFVLLRLIGIALMGIGIYAVIHIHLGL